MKEPGLDQLRVFLTVVDRGTFSAAALQLGVSQPTLSSRIRHLEQDLGTTLFDRSGARPRLTSTGRLLAHRARALLDQLRSALDEIDHLSSGPLMGTLRIAGTTTVGERVLPDLLQRFLRDHPDVDVEFSVMNTRDVIQSVEDGTFALALIAGASTSRALTATSIGTEPQVVICSAGHPLAGQEVEPAVLHGSTILMREPGSTTRAYQDDLAAQWAIPSARNASIASTAAIVHAVAAELGISCVPLVSAADGLTVGRVARLHLGPAPSHRPIELVRKPDRVLTRVESLFVAQSEGEPSA